MTSSRRPSAYNPDHNTRERTDQAKVVNAVRFLGTPPGVLTPHMLASLSGVALDPRSASHAKQQGLEPGWPDLMFFRPLASGECGLAIELKRLIGSYGVTQAQGEKHLMLHTQGWRVVVCYGWKEAVRELAAAYPDVFPVTV